MPDKRLDGQLPWYALRVRSNREQTVASHLRGRGLEEYLPCYKVTSQWSDRKKIVDKILFPGYVFCRLDTLNRLPALSVPGVLGIVGFAEVPTPIPDIEMERVALTIQSGLAVIPWPHISTGDWILVEKGPLAGVEGILVRVKGAHRIVVSFNLLQRSVSAEVDREWIRPIKNIKSATL